MGKHDIVENQKRKLEWVKKEARLVIAVSENTKKDIVELLGIPAKKIRVIYEASNEKLKIQNSKFKIDEIKRKYGIEGNYILALGGSPRKNLGRLIKAYNVSVTQYLNIELVIVGNSQNTKYQIPNTKYLGYVPQDELASLYSGALCFVYPSLYEGFGLPVLEAMACGCPVVTSNVSSLPEVAGEAAVLVDPLSEKSIAAGIKEVLKKREDMVKRGYERVKLFSWEKCARETLAVYQEAASVS
jgi:glycosyltransferase involved in cell wall biosynthesis